jgi:hypothetical protein
LNALDLLQSEVNADKKLSETKAIFEALQIQQRCQEEMRKHYDFAMNALATVQANYSMDELTVLSNYLFHREY